MIKKKKINELNNKNLLGKAEKGDNPTIIEPFNIKSLPEKEKYDEGVVLSMAKLYDYILDNSNPDQKPNQPEEYTGKKPDDDEQYNSLVYGALSPEDPVNKVIVKNI